MDNNLFEEISKGLIINYYRTHFPLLYDEYKDELTENRVYCVWICKTLQNNKGLFSTNIPDSRYFEITYNGDKQEIYFDSYVKESNTCIKDW